MYVGPLIGRDKLIHLEEYVLQIKEKNMRKYNWTDFHHLNLKPFLPIKAKVPTAVR